MTRFGAFTIAVAPLAASFWIFGGDDRVAVAAICGGATALFVHFLTNRGWA